MAIGQRGKSIVPKPKRRVINLETQTLGIHTVKAVDKPRVPHVFLFFVAVLVIPATRILSVLLVEHHGGSIARPGAGHHRGVFKTADRLDCALPLALYAGDGVRERVRKGTHGSQGGWNVCCSGCTCATFSQCLLGNDALRFGRWRKHIKSSKKATSISRRRSQVRRVLIEQLAVSRVACCSIKLFTNCSFAGVAG